MNPSCQRTLQQTRRIRRIVVDLWQEVSGAVALEYGLIAALIIVAILGSIGQLGEALLGLPLQQLIDAFTGALA